MAEEKTEQATPRRLQKAREEGDSGVSTYAAQAVAFLAVTAILPGAVRALAESARADLRGAIAHAAERPASVSFDPSALGARVIGLVMPVLVVAMLASAVVLVVQTGGFIATKKVTPDLGRLDVFEGIKRLFTAARLFAVVRALFAAAVVSWIAVRVLRAHALDLARSSGQLDRAAEVAGTLALTLARDAALFGLALGVVDLVVVRQGWMKRLRMSKDEVRREHKDSEGDPQVKAARERAHHEAMTAATLASVRTATVVVVNPTHIACALRYGEGGDGSAEDDAPVVVASWEGDLAARILRAAREYGVPVVQNVPLARALRELEVGDQIPEALYGAVAEILREVWDQDSGHKR
jgi:flagellar biosynthesis protein FlhB